MRLRHFLDLEAREVGRSREQSKVRGVEQIMDANDRECRLVSESGEIVRVGAETFRGDAARFDGAVRRRLRTPDELHGAAQGVTQDRDGKAREVRAHAT